jgi:hypothetical protein
MTARTILFSIIITAAFCICPPLACAVTVAAIITGIKL